MTSFSIVNSDALNAVTPIFCNKYNESKLQEILQKRTFSTAPLADCTKEQLYSENCRRLEEGILAIKFNYSNKLLKHVELKLSKNRKSIQYTAIGPL